MAYGLSVLTTEGYVSTVDMRTVRFFGHYDKTGTSGTQTLTGFDSSKGVIYISPKDGKLPPLFDYNNTTKSFSWDNTTQSNANDYSSDFRLILLENA